LKAAGIAVGPPDGWGKLPPAKPSQQTDHLSTTYPSGTTTNGNGTIITTPGPSYNYSYDSMYRLSGMTDSNYNTIVSGVSYNAANQLLSINYPGNNETRSYNVLNQLTNVTASSENLTYNYPTGANNGKVSSMYNAVSGETVTYTYDSLNRLLTATGSGWGDQYGFDPFGNLLSKTVTAGSAPSMSISVNTANNQIQGIGLGYDANGNTTTNFNGGVSNTLTYDAENRVSTYQPYIGLTTSYAYDTQNRRIWSWPGTTDTWGNVSGYTVNIYTPSGQKLAAYTVAPAVNDYNGQATPFMGSGVATSDQYFGSRWLAAIDQLGSVGTYFPWGENRGGTNPQDTWSFATYWQDSVSGLDYANNRYYSNAYGRFMTPDPSTVSQDPKAPQSWSRYPYVVGDPVNLNDPTGLYLQCTPPNVPNADGSSCVAPDPGPPTAYSGDVNRAFRRSE
jgi:RHS repeat-associated protein